MRLRILLGLAALTIACSSSAPGGFSKFDAGAKDGASGTGGSGRGEGELGGFGEGDGGASFSCAPSPANYVIPGNGCDDDGDGQVDNPPACDTGLAANGDAAAFARALGLCQTAGAGDAKWGVVSATYTNGYGRTASPNGAQHGILPKFGNVIKPREGGALGVLSTGYAREYDSATGQRDFKSQGSPMQATGGVVPTAGAVPPGFPKPAAGCPSNNAVYDTITLKLQIKVPANAKGLLFDFNFWSGEWPEYVCSRFNDGFIAYLKSEGFNNNQPDNISFDAQSNPVSVNNGFFDRCTPQSQTGCDGLPAVTKTAACPGGVAELAGTGFGEPEDTYCGKRVSPGGATGWLQTAAPVKPGEVITLELMIWDTGDPNYDSSVLLDNFRWAPGEVVTSTERPR